MGEGKKVRRQDLCGLCTGPLGQPIRRFGLVLPSASPVAGADLGPRRWVLYRVARPTGQDSKVPDPSQKIKGSQLPLAYFPARKVLLAVEVSKRVCTCLPFSSSADDEPKS